MTDLMGAGVLSIQSHVVHGCVGNRAAVFPLQFLGAEVDVINTTHFSNHTGYSKWTGPRLSAEDLQKTWEGMNANGFAEHYSYIITGYVGNAALLESVTSVVKECLALSQSAVYVCDPVMGDNGRLYVSAECAHIYKTVLIPLANIVTPNAFEAEVLTGIKVTDVDSGKRACDAIHRMGPEYVVITSIDIDSDTLCLLASTRLPHGQPARQAAMTFPRLPVYYSGTGDLFTALVVGYGHACRLPDGTIDVATVCERAVAVIQHLLKVTTAAGKKELMLVQCRDFLKDPVITHRAKSV